MSEAQSVANKVIHTFLMRGFQLSKDEGQIPREAIVELVIWRPNSKASFAYSMIETGQIICCLKPQFSILKVTVIWVLQYPGEP